MRLLPPVRPSTCARVRHSGAKNSRAVPKKSNPSGQDADDGRGGAIEDQRLADDLGIAVEAPLPHGVADERNRRHLVHHVFGFGEGAAHDWLDAKRAEHAGRHGLAEDPFGRHAVTLESERLHAAGDAVESGDGLERSCVVPERGEPGDAGRSQLVGPAGWDGPDRDKAVRVGAARPA